MSWVHDRKAGRGVLKSQDRQYRPSQTELKVLLLLRLVLESKEHSAPIVPNMAHPLVQKFYRGKAAPQMLDKKLTGPVAITNPNIGRAMLTRGEPETSAPAATGNQVNASLDPRLQGRLAHTKTSITPTAATFNLTDNTAQATGLVSNQNTNGGRMEERLQELEDELMKLKTENILKDREIRRLKTENGQLRGIGYDTGSKRPRV